MNGNCEKLLRSFPENPFNNVQHEGGVAYSPVFIPKSIDGSVIQNKILISNITFAYQATDDALLFNNI